MKIRQYSVVRDVEDQWGEDHIFFGEMPNVPGHCIVFGIKSEKIRFGLHTERFEELSEDET